MKEEIEYEPASEDYKEFLRKYGNLTEEEIQHHQVVKLKPCTDWEAELAAYLHIGLPAFTLLSGNVYRVNGQKTESGVVKIKPEIEAKTFIATV